MTKAEKLPTSPVLTRGTMDAQEIIRQMHEEAQQGVLCMWTVYDKPTDFPDTFVARRHDVGKGGKPLPTEHLVTGPLSALRVLFLQAGSPASLAISRTIR